jgi:hypothetical protein
MGKITSGGVETAPAALAFEVLCLLVGDEDLEVVKVALAVEAPGPLELLVEVWVSLPLLRHGGGCEVLEGFCVGRTAARRLSQRALELRVSLPFR